MCNGRFEESAIQLESTAQEGNPNAQHQLGQLLFDIVRDKKRLYKHRKSSLLT